MRGPHIIHGLRSRLIFVSLSVVEVLLQLVVATATFKPLQQVLAVDVLDDGSLCDALQALEDA